MTTGEMGRSSQRRAIVRGVLIAYLVASQIVAVFVVGGGPIFVALLASGLLAIVIHAALFVDWRARHRSMKFLRALQPSLVPHSRGAVIRLTLLVLLSVGVVFIGSTVVAAVCLAGLILLVVFSLARGG